MTNIKKIVYSLFSIGITTFMISCSNTSEEASTEVTEEKERPQMQIAHLGQGDEAGLAAIRKTFKERNEGYDLAYFNDVQLIEASKDYRVAFIQTGGGTATLTSGKSSKFSVGDIILLDQGEAIKTDSLFSALLFTSPEPAPDSIPTFVRPDWDPNITDTPGGCATETNAYRRILLTWRSKVGPYLYHALNAHRVRIMDSFSHYHPVVGGFDEFYLVQMVQSNAQIITSNKVDWIEKPETVSKEQTEDLIQSTPLQVGDLVYLPRGLMHRGFGGVLAQVITIPGFIPGSEIGVDHHLRRINEILALRGRTILPFNEAASTEAVVK